MPHEKQHFNIMDILFGRKEAREQYAGGLQVIGAGFGRTGTSSLKKALEILHDNAPCYHMSQVIENGWADFWSRMDRGEISPDEIRLHFQKYASTTDNPACIHWKKLLDTHPGSKVILSVRDPEGWAKSILDTVGNFQPGNPNMPFGVWVVQHTLPFWIKWAHMMRTCRWGEMFFKPDGKADFSKEHLVKIFNDWNASVKAECPKDKLLVFDVKEGWEPLCKFLGKPIPDQPFPNLNDTKEMKKIVAIMNSLGWIICAAGVAATAFGARVILARAQ